jgi:hypothetical protein
LIAVIPAGVIPSRPEQRALAHRIVKMYRTAVRRQNETSRYRVQTQAQAGPLWEVL